MDAKKRDVEVKILCICPMDAKRRDVGVKIFSICPMGSKRRDVEVKIFSICPMGFKRQDIEVKIFCICPAYYIILYNILNSLTDLARHHRIVHCIQMNPVRIICQKINDLA